MSLAAGTRVGPYEITGALGAGGMGEVYRARDGRLDRDVAIKVLPAAFAQDAERVARFRREAQVLASLDDPRIAAIHGLEETDGVLALALELVEGEDLAQRLERGPLPVDEALAIARQVAEGLEAAHERGIVHRDLKPANLKVTTDGRVKILDFGLAKAWSGDAAGGSSADLSQSPTLAHGGTQAGIILGTAAYMSPEQARGKAVDRRADIWAFGVVLFEMLTGKRLFAGETVSDTLAAVLRQEVDWNALPPGTPPSLKRLLRRCLVRDPKQRLRDIGEARIALEGAAADEGSPGVGVARAARGRWLLLLAAFAAGAALAALTGWLVNGRRIESHPVRRFGLGGLNLGIDAFQGLALSPDGGRLVFRARSPDGIQRLFLRPLDSLEARPIAGTDGGWLPFFSPDGEWVGFFTEGSLKKVALAGGSPLTLATVSSGSGGAWLPDDTIVFAGEVKGLERVPASGGTPEAVLTAGDAGRSRVGAPWALPGGGALLFSVRRADSFDVAVVSLAERAVRVIARDGFAPIYSPTGHVVYQALGSGTLMAVPFDTTRLVVTGKAFPVLSDVWPRVSSQARAFVVAGDGTLAYIPRSPSLERGALLWVDRTGASTPIVEIERPLDSPRLSPDGRLIAFRAPAPNCDVWVHDLRRGVTTRITLEGDNHGVAWSPDGRRIAFARGLNLDWTVLAGSADGSGSAEPLLSAGIPRAWATSWSPDGRALLLTSTDASTGSDINLLSIPERTVKPLIHSPFREEGGAFSPDGRFIAYVSNESGRDEVYVQSFPALDLRQQISTDGGVQPAWSRSGRELFFRQGGRMLVVEFKAGRGLEASRPRVLFEGDFSYGSSTFNRGYDVDLEGRRFLMARELSQAIRSEINVVLNWADELRRHDAAGKP